MYNKKNILFIIPSLFMGGLERQFCELIKKISVEENFNVHLILFDPNLFYKELYSLDIKINFITHKLKIGLKPFFLITKYIKENKIEVIDAWSGLSVLYSIPASILYGVKIINNQIRDAKKLKIFSTRWCIAKFNFLFSDIILGNSTAGIIAYNAPKKKSFVIYNGFDFERIQNLTPIREIREKFYIKTPFVVVMIARFHEHKDFDTFLNAALETIAKRDDVTFLAVGDGPLFNYYNNKYNNKKIIFTGEQRDVESIINSADIGVLCSNPLHASEGFPNSIMEYMALGKGTISSNTGGTSELINDNYNGFLIPPADPLQLSEKINYLLDNKHILIELGRRAKENIINNFSIDIMIKNHSAFLTENNDFNYRK